MNKVNLVGRITKDVEPHYSTGENANANCRFTVAVNRKFKNKETGQYDADFISCVAFGKTCEFIAKYFHKGDPIGISGNIRTGTKKTAPKKDRPLHPPFSIKNMIFVPSTPATISATALTRIFQIGSFTDNPAYTISAVITTKPIARKILKLSIIIPRNNV